MDKKDALRLVSYIEFGNHWVWNGHIDSKGYARIKINDKNRHVHKILFNRFKNNNTRIYRICDDLKCVKPEHYSEFSNKRYFELPEKNKKIAEYLTNN